MSREWYLKRDRPFRQEVFKHFEMESHWVYITQPQPS